jgi:hypothetical protein
MEASDHTQHDQFWVPSEALDNPDPPEHDQLCIQIDWLDEPRGRPMTVARYHEVLTQRYAQPLWARTAPPVHTLTTEPSERWGVRVADPAAYEAQMLRLLGLE